MQSEDLLKLGQKFLEEAKEDIEDAEILLKEGRARRTLFHMQQASEKILKAVAYSLLISQTALLYDTAVFCSQRYNLQVPPHHRKVWSFLGSTNSLRNPRSLGHSLRPLLERFVRQFIELSMDGGLQEFTDWFYSNCVEAVGREFLGMVQKRMPSLHQDVNHVIAVLRDIYSLYRSVLYESYTRRLAGALLDYGTVVGVESYDELLKIAKKMIDSGACLAKCVELCTAFENALLEVAENKDFLSYFNELRESLVERPILRQLIPAIRDLLRKVREVDENELKWYSEVLTEIFSRPRLFILLLKYFIPLHIIPLHMCLTKYERSSRYPDEGDIPEEDLKPQTLGKVLEALKNIHSEVEEVIGLQLKLYRGSDHNRVNA